jgi:hypothetical protein
MRNDARFEKCPPKRIDILLSAICIFPRIFRGKFSVCYQIGLKKIEETQAAWLQVPLQVLRAKLGIC